ncbi:hypothetical protein CEXT_5241 [Caerostris extrusa]|uniref:Uncharacterized protein n=1 Tax=Caerostris extrusa TaxID=172846 RepID=A0AAV4XB83_CAEEX|nr:hypothetical protein CEXT_5241 [Caerostris extrusa]
MQQYGNGEFADMHLMHGIAAEGGGGAGRAAERIHRERFSDMYQPHRSSYAHIRQTLCYYGLLRSNRKACPNRCVPLLWKKLCWMLWRTLITSIGTHFLCLKSASLQCIPCFVRRVLMSI